MSSSEPSSGSGSAEVGGGFDTSTRSRCRGCADPVYSAIVPTPVAPACCRPRILPPTRHSAAEVVDAVGVVGDRRVGDRHRAARDGDARTHPVGSLPGARFHRRPRPGRPGFPTRSNPSPTASSTKRSRPRHRRNRARRTEESAGMPFPALPPATVWKVSALRRGAAGARIETAAVATIEAPHRHRRRCRGRVSEVVRVQVPALGMAPPFPSAAEPVPPAWLREARCAEPKRFPAVEDRACRCRRLPSPRRPFEPHRVSRHDERPGAPDPPAVARPGGRGDWPKEQQHPEMLDSIAQQLTVTDDPTRRVDAHRRRRPPLRPRRRGRSRCRPIRPRCH